MKHPKQVTSFNLGDWYYEHKDYGNGQHRYTKTQQGKICPLTIQKWEFDKVKKEKTELTDLTNNF